MSAPVTFQIADRLSRTESSPVRDILAVVGRGEVISFAGGIPDPELFDQDRLAEAFHQVLTEHGRRALQYATTQGEPELREQAARRLSRRLPTDPDQLQITSGSQEGLHLSAQALINPGDLVLVEEPTYLAAIQAFRLAGAELGTVQTDAEGMLPDALDAALAQRRPAFVYLIPTFQNPTGRSMSAQRRIEVAEVLQRHQVPLVEDDPYGELRFDGEPTAPLASLIPEQTVLLNSASKVMAPGVRIGWLRAPQPVLRTIELAKQAVGLQTAVTDQLAVAHYLAHNDLDAHIARIVGVYRSRRDAMLAALDQQLPAGAVRTDPSGGMFVWVQLGGGIDTATRLSDAVNAGVAFVPGWAFFAARPDRSTMRLSYVTNQPDVIHTGIERLATVMGWR